MTFIKIYLCAILIVLGDFCLVGQDRKPPGKSVEPEEAEEHFRHTNYLMALKAYKELLNDEPQNIEYNYKAAICYLRTNIDKSLAIPLLEFVTQQPKHDNEAWFEMGRAYHYAMRFDEAIKAYTNYKINAKGKDLLKGDRYIEMCDNAKQLIRFPVDVTFENVGKEVNSPYPDYYPLVSKDEATLVFTTRRKENVGARLEFDGYYPSDIYISRVKDGAWSKAADIGRLVNTQYDEQAVGMSSDAQQIVVYIDHIDSLGNLYISEYKKGKYQKIRKLNDEVNKAFERSGSISPDNEIIFFASERESSFGETDLYMSRKLPNGEWAKAQNLGPNINTKFREDFPFLAEDGRTLYFASEGHSSMGNYDLFKAIWNPEENTWSKPVNLGYPLNTPDEDRCISFTKDNRVAYISAARKGGYGDLDIYRVRFNVVEQRYAIVTGYVVTADTLKRGVEAAITVTDLSTKKEYTYVPVKGSGKYVMALTPGRYAITIVAPGFKPFSDAIIIYDMGSFQPETEKNFQLEKAP